MTETFSIPDRKAWYKSHFGPDDRPGRYYDNFYERRSFAKDEVDPEVIWRFKHLARGSTKRLACRLTTNLTLDTIYRCVKGNSVGDSVAVDFESAFGNYLWSPNFDTPSCPPPEGLEELGDWINEFIGARGWIAEKLGIKESTVGNALQGRSKDVERRTREFCTEFYEARLNMDVPNPEFEEQNREYRRKLEWRAYRIHQIAEELYKRNSQRWEDSAEKRELDARVRGGADRTSELNTLRREGVDEATDSRTFESWCGVRRDLIAQEAKEEGFGWLQRPTAWEFADLGTRLNP